MLAWYNITKCFAVPTIYLVHMHRLWVPGIAHIIKQPDYNQWYGNLLYVQFNSRKSIIPDEVYEKLKQLEEDCHLLWFGFPKNMQWMAIELRKIFLKNMKLNTFYYQPNTDLTPGGISHLFHFILVVIGWWYLDLQDSSDLLNFNIVCLFLLPSPWYRFVCQG